MATRGKYIVIEGPDGVGKTVQANRVVEALQARAIPVELIREPGGTAFAEQLRSILLSQTHRNRRTDALLFNAGRVETMLRVEELLRAGTWAVAARNWLSTIVYQGHAQDVAEEELSFLRALCQWAVGDVRPDLFLVLTAPFAVLEQRARDRKLVDHFEAKERAFKRRLAEGYSREAERLGLLTVDASGAIEEVFDLIWKQVTPMLPRSSPAS